MQFDLEGSSPLTRGKRGAARLSAAPPRLIPAHAGKTPWTWTPPRSMTAHPRSRGENEGRDQVGQATAGSSPLTRGKLDEGELSALITRLIPAHAGKTRRRASLTGGRPAHPRSRGENLAMSSRVSLPSGSSPLTRGKPTSAAGAASRCRLIPAHAGKTLRRRRGAG